MTLSQRIDQRIAELNNWRGESFAKLRGIIRQADPGISEGWKWDTAVWTHAGNICAVGAFKDHLKVNFFKGAALADPQGLFNAGLEAKDSRAINFQEGDPINEAALKELIREAIRFNGKKS